MLRVLPPIACALFLGCGGEPKPADAPATTAPPNVPAAGLDPFTEYKLSAMTSEAKVNVRMLADGARMMALETEVGADGQPVPALTESAPLTPAVGACCKEPGGTCPADPDRFAHPTFKAIMFDVSGPHRYSYELVVGEGSFTARAVGDLDCDGITSLYEQVGTIAGDEVTMGELKIENPLE